MNHVARFLHCSLVRVKRVAWVAISLGEKNAFACITYTLNITHYHRVIANKHPSITHSKGLLFAIWFTFVHSFIPCAACSESKWTPMTVILIIVRCRVSPRFLAVTEGFCTLLRTWQQSWRDARGANAVMRSRSDRHVRGYMRAFPIPCVHDSSTRCDRAVSHVGPLGPWKGGLTQSSCICVCVILGQPFPWNVPPPAK